MIFMAAFGCGRACEAAPKQCHARIEVKLEPHISNPRDPAFLSGLAANPLYTLTWVSGPNDTAVYDLTGPATDYGCEEEIRRLRKSAHVLALNVQYANPANSQ
jgi:hypothetical protein